MLTDMRKYDYTELVAWQRAMDLAVAVYQASAALPAEERFGLQAQMRRWFQFLPTSPKDKVAELAGSS